MRRHALLADGAAPRVHAVARHAFPPRTTICLPPAALRPSPARQYWRTFRLGRAARRDGVDLYHGLSHEIPRDLPRTGIPGVVTFHDLLFVRHPELFPAADRLSYALAIPVERRACDGASWR